MKHKKWLVPFMAFLFIFLIAPSASAHVTVNPGESSTDAWEKYSVRIPVEKDINTTKLELKVPKGINLVSVMPAVNWDYEFEKDENDNITAVTWTATDEGIGQNEFAEFYFIAANPSEPGEFSWEAFQTYEDDSVVEWVGAPDADEPASVTKVTEGDAVAQHGDEADATADETASEDADANKADSTTSGNNSWLPTLLAAVAILLALISLFRKRA
jgi:uncharacterized protein YcnI